MAAVERSAETDRRSEHTKGYQGREITSGTPHKSKKHAWDPEQTSQGALSKETATAHPHPHNTRACHRQHAVQFTQKQTCSEPCPDCPEASLWLTP